MYASADIVWRTPIVSSPLTNYYGCILNWNAQRWFLSEISVEKEKLVFTNDTERFKATLKIC